MKRFVRASISNMTSDELEAAKHILSAMSNDELLHYYTKYAVKCGGAPIECPDSNIGDLFTIAEEELRSRLGLSNSELV
jgi:hypothetical protein